MKIEDILEELKEKNEIYKECSKNGIIENEYYKSHILLDYITILQRKEYNNSKAIEYIKTTSFFNKSHYDFKKDLLNILDKGE